ncbi:MAG TPA: 50S ribosomal protein L25 [Polyangiaceae bacterium]|jgi:large subunit ribosomal protein L25|nr:50S ribosomal protein L25 [Polyangiaceae bacterium]
MEIVKLSAQKRVGHGKGPSRRLRNQGQIPAIAYGPKRAATQLAISPKDLKVVLGSAHGKNTVVEIAVEGGEKITAMVREYAHHPVTRGVLHADFREVDLAAPVDVEVPFRLTGKAKGIVNGGIVSQVFRALPIRCLPEKIPVIVELDISDLDLGESKKANQVPVPEGVSIRLAPEQTVAAVIAPEKVKEEEATAAKAAAPAAGAAAPAAAAGAAAKAPAADKKKK